MLRKYYDTVVNGEREVVDLPHVKNVREGVDADNGVRRDVDTPDSRVDFPQSFRVAEQGGEHAAFVFFVDIRVVWVHKNLAKKR